MASRNFNQKQALEREVKDIYAKITAASQAEAVLDLATDITLTSVAYGAARNSTTVELVVEAPAANPTDTVLVDFSGDADAIVITVTPNDGTNNTATPVALDEDELAELINTGAVAGKTITLTDADSLRALQTAAGGAASALSASDDQVATFADGADAELVSPVGVASVSRTDVGVMQITLQDAYASVKHVDAILLQSSAADIQFQVSAEAVASDKTVDIMCLTGATPTDLDPSAAILVKLELKNV